MRAIPTSTLALMLACACAGPQAAKPTAARDPQLTRAAAQLVDAPPADWPEAVDALSAPAAAPEAVADALLTALLARPDGRGAICAFAVLGETRTPAASEFLCDTVAEGGERGREAALALGRCEDAAVIPALVAAVDDRGLDAGTRCACAAALLDLGAQDEALPFLSAVILAGTPAGAADRERLGLPDRARWALERTIAIDAIERYHGDRFGLMPDLAWPDLAARVATMREVLGGGTR